MVDILPYYTDPADVSLDGLKIAKVINNADPKAQLRVGVRVIGVHDIDHKDDEYFVWANWLRTDKSITIQPPDIGDWIYVMFPNKNDPNLIVWLGWCTVSN